MFAGFRDRTFLDDAALSDRYRTFYDLDRLHVRAVHDTWGIADGLVVELFDGGDGSKVSEGVGYDNEGTPLELTKIARLQPDDAGDYDIVLTECGVCAQAAGAPRPCDGSLVLAAVRAVWVNGAHLQWTDLRHRSQLVRRRESTSVRAGSVDVELGKRRCRTERRCRPRGRAFVPFPSTSATSSTSIQRRRRNRRHCTACGLSPRSAVCRAGAGRCTVHSSRSAQRR